MLCKLLVEITDKLQTFVVDNFFQSNNTTTENPTPTENFTPASLCTSFKTTRKTELVKGDVVVAVQDNVVFNDCNDTHAHTHSS